MPCYTYGMARKQPLVDEDDTMTTHDSAITRLIGAYALHDAERANELHAEWATLSADKDNRGSDQCEDIDWFVEQLFDLLGAAAPDGVITGYPAVRWSVARGFIHNEYRVYAEGI